MCVCPLLCHAREVDRSVCAWSEGVAVSIRLISQVKTRNRFLPLDNLRSKIIFTLTVLGRGLNERAIIFTYIYASNRNNNFRITIENSNFSNKEAKIAIFSSRNSRVQIRMSPSDYLDIILAATRSQDERSTALEGESSLSQSDASLNRPRKRPNLALAWYPLAGWLNSDGESRGPAAHDPLSGSLQRRNRAYAPILDRQ